MALYSSSVNNGRSAQPPRKTKNAETKITKSIFIRDSYRCTESVELASGKWQVGGMNPLWGFHFVLQSGLDLP